MLKKIVVVIASFIFVFSLVACNGQGRGQKIGKSIDKSVSKTGKFLKKTGKQIKKKLD